MIAARRLSSGSSLAVGSALPLAGILPVEPTPIAPAATSPGAERRQLTVMFCDLVGSTEMAARMDPEDLRDIIGAYHRCVAKTAARFRGFVAKYMGDGVLVYFGYPRAHEDDAERAVRAGLKLVAKVAELQPRPASAFRSGSVSLRVSSSSAI